jgi:hypothetical protein
MDCSSSGTPSRATRSRCHCLSLDTPTIMRRCSAPSPAATTSDCSGGPFHVVYVGREEESDTWASLYSSETSTWSPTTRIDRLSLSAIVDDDIECSFQGSHLNRDMFYLFVGQLLLKYDLGDRSLTAVDVPEMVLNLKSGIIMTAEDGALGFAGMDDTSRLYLWSRTDAGWALRRVIKLDGLIPNLNQLDYPEVVAFMEGTSTVFISTDVGVFTMDLKSMKVTKVGEQGDYVTVLPYASFYAPAAAGTYVIFMLMLSFLFFLA